MDEAKRVVCDVCGKYVMHYHNEEYLMYGVYAVVVGVLAWRVSKWLDKGESV